MTMGEFLRSLREQKQWKQPEAAQQIAIEQSYLSKLENNKAVPSTDIFQRLQQVYGFTVEQLTNELGHEELTKLKDIVSIREFVNNTRQAKYPQPTSVNGGSCDYADVGRFVIRLWHSDERQQRSVLHLRIERGN